MGGDSISESRCADNTRSRTLSFDKALAFTLQEEGGFVDNPHDSGGATNHGITQSVYDSFRDRTHMPRQSVGLITDTETNTIYDEDYWEPSRAQSMHSPLDVAHFDWSVNHGIQGALKTLQAALGVTPDGIWGAQSASALAISDPVETAQTYNTLRREWYRNRVAQKPDQAVFLNGWLQRVDRLDAYMETL
jgi:lysozyme family protein